MSLEAVKLRGVAWDHPRGTGPMRATAALFRTLNPNVQVAWEARSLEGFGFTPLGELSREYDLLLVDHPHIGPSVPGALLPLDELLPALVLDRRAQNSVGPSHGSYRWLGHQWALAVDAAAQVSAYRPDLISRDSLPRTWEEVRDFARELPTPRRMGLPLVPIDICCVFLTLCANRSGGSFWSTEWGFDREVVDWAVELLADLVEHCHPVSREANAPQILEELAQRDDLAYVPLVFGYSNYAREGFRRHIVRFTDIPTASERPVGSVLGGVGLAVSADCSHPDVAADYVARVASADWQRNVYFDAGGQPADRGAWEDERVNARSANFFRDTRQTLELSYLRPRLAEMPHSLEVQRRLGELLHASVGSLMPRRLAAEIVTTEQRLAQQEGTSANDRAQ
jgi:multiple sugar transport system substrate-binding protein